MKKYYRISVIKFLISGIIMITFLPASIKGIISDSDGVPVEGVRVSVEGVGFVEEMITGKDGGFYFNATHASIYFLTFTKLGYEDKVITIQLNSRENRELNILLDKLRRLPDYQEQHQSLNTGFEQQKNTSTRLGEEVIMNMRIIKADNFSGTYANLYSLVGSAYISIFTLKGISSANMIDPLVGIYIDGMAQLQSYHYPIHLGNIQSIEVLKGSQITLYGRNAMVGIIDIKTKTPPNRFSLVGSGEWFSGSYDRFSGQSYDLSVSIPLVKGKAYLKGGGFVYHKKGIFYNNYLNKFTDSALNFNAYLRSDLFLSGMDLFIQSKYERVREGAFPYSENKKQALSRPYFLYHNFENYSEKDIVDNAISLKIPLRFFDIISVWNYQYFKRGLGVDTDFGSEDTFLKIAFDQHLFTGETKLISADDSSKYFSWSLGNYTYFQKRDIDAESEANIESTDNTQLDIDGVSFGIAFFGSITYPILDNFHFIAGIRGDYDYQNTKIDKEIISDSETTIENTRKVWKKHFWFFAPKAAFNFYFDNLNLLYLSVSRSFRSGGINTFTSQIGKLVYNSENTWNTELGFKSQFIPEYHGSLLINLFYIYWIDPQVNVFLSDTDNIFDFGIVNAEKSHSLGVGLELDLPIIWGFSVGGTYGFSRSVFLDFTTPQSVQVKGNFQPFVPEHTISTFFQHKYDFEIFSKRDTMIHRFDFKYMSKIYYDPENILTQDGYHTLNYTLNVRINGIVTSFWVENILDTRFFDFAIPLGSRLIPKLGNPRTFGAKISLIF